MQVLHVLNVVCNRFIEDFCKKENNGLTLLLNLLRNIQKIAKEMNSVPSKEIAQTRKRLLVWTKSEKIDDIKCDHQISRYTSILSLCPFFLIPDWRTGLFGVRQILSPSAGNVT